ncbi:MAG: prolyl oligopeptidase family serine peptidase [Planctomycetota bacterium]
MVRSSLAAAIAVSVSLTSALAAESEPPLTHEVYDSWNFLRGSDISSDGEWALFTVAPGDGDATVVVRSTGGPTEHEFLRGTRAAFTRDAMHAVMLVEPDEEVLEQQKKDKVKLNERDKNALHVLELASGDIIRVERVRSFELPSEAGGVIAFLHEKPLPEKKEEKKEGEEEKEEQAETKPEAQPEPAEKKPKEPAEQKPEQSEESEEKDDEKKKPKKKKPGTELVLHRLGDGSQSKFPNAVEYEFSENGQRLAFATSAEAEEDDGVFVVDVVSGEVTQVVSGRGHYKSLAWTEDGAQLAFLSDRDDYEAEDPAWNLWHWAAGNDEAAVVAAEGSAGVPKGWWIADNRAPSFSDSGARLFFGTQPRPEPEPEKDEEAEDDDEPEVRVDVWHWQDARMMPQQLLRANDERNRAYDAMLSTADLSIMQLENEAMPSVNVGSDGDAHVAVANTDVPYSIIDSWESPGYVDVILIDLETGERHTVAEKFLGFGAQLSPESKYLTWWDGTAKHYFGLAVEDVLTGSELEPVNLTSHLPHAVHNELHDSPRIPNPYGAAGWTKDDAAVLVYDRYDVWAIDPSGFWSGAAVTDGYGRESGIRFRYLDVDPDEDAIDANGPLFLTAFHLKEKSEGVFRDSVRGTRKPRELLMLDENIGAIEVAKDDDRVIMTRERFDVPTDLWASDLGFERFRRLSNVNPQTEEYNWGTSEIHEWISADGVPLQGILNKPEDFDPDKKYPMIVYFYERLSDRLHNYVEPAPARASINVSYYVSNGYVVFQPDIPYREGFPGRSAESAIMPGVTSVLALGFVDPDRVGVQGHSWGGYQALHLITVTDMFAAAEAGAPVSNMTSAYGGIRWASGLVRQFQYERTQSRIGGSLWEKPSHYIENSPLFRADEIDTPLLMMHNDKDGAVPWYQGIEIFAAMRRLGKPAWMLNYNGEAHGLRRRHNQKDWSVRMQQFFDHYLKDAPPPEWLVNGVPAVKKGKTLGLELLRE